MVRKRNARRVGSVQKAGKAENWTVRDTAEICREVGTEMIVKEEWDLRHQTVEAARKKEDGSTNTVVAEKGADLGLVEKKENVSVKEDQIQ